MDEQKDLPLPQKDLPLPEKSLPAGRQVLPPPHEMQLEPPNDMLLRAPTFWEKYPFLKWFLPLLIALLVIIPAALYVLNQQKSKEQTQNSDAQQKQSQVRQMTPTAAPEEEFSIEQIDAKSKKYLNHKYNFEIIIPNTIDPYTDESGISFTTSSTDENDQIGMSNSSMIYVSVIPQAAKETGLIYNYDPSEARILLSMSLNETKVTRNADDPELGKYWTYKRIPDTKIDSLNAKAFMSYKVWEGPADMIEKRLYVQKGDYLYLIGAYLLPTDITERQFDAIVSSLKFRDQITDTTISNTPTQSSDNQSVTSCTREAKVCPDGSSVGRTGPNCEFAACPQ